MSAWLKAGLFVGVGIIIITLIGQIAYVGGCISLPLTIIAYIIAGVLAANFMPSPRETGAAAGQGALAAVLASFVGGTVNLIIGTIRAAAGGVAQGAQYLSQLPPELRHQIQDFGIGPELLAGIGGGLLCGSICCVVGILIAAALGAGGGAIFAAAKPQ